jgi:Phospholipase_D-nuclease N-terminal
MSRGSKLFVGLVSFLPLVFLIVFCFMFFNLIPEIIRWEDHDPDPYSVFETIRPVFMIGMIIALVSLGLLVFFIIHMINNKNIETGERVIWILVFLFAGVVGYPIYWYMRVWKDHPF